MATLAGSTIASTYTYLLKMDGTSGVTSSLVKVQDGDATDTALSVSTTDIAVDATDKIYLDAGSDTYIVESGADVLDFYTGGVQMLQLLEASSDYVWVPVDATKMALGAGKDLQLYTSSDNAYIENITSDKDMIFRVNDGGTNVDFMTIDASAQTLNVNSTIAGATATTLNLVSTQGGASGVYLDMYHDAATGAAADDTASRITTYGERDDNNKYWMSYIQTLWTNPAVGTGTSRIEFHTRGGDTDYKAITIDHAGDQTNTGNIIIDSDTKGLVLGADQDVTLFSSGAGEMYVVRGTDVTPTPGETTGWVYMAIGDSGSTYMTIAGGETGAAVLNLYADNGDNDDDKYKIEAQNDGTLSFNTHSAGSWSTNMAIDGSVGSVRMATQPAFLARPSGTQSNIPINTVEAVAFGNEIFDQGGDFTGSTFTAPVTGRYQLNVSIAASSIDSAAAYITMRFVTSNRNYDHYFDPDFGQDAAYWTTTASVLVDMDASDTASIGLYQSGGSAQMDVEGDSHFSGFLAC